MKIWIDGKEANVLNRVGSGQYAFEIIKNLERIDQKNDYTILLPVPAISDLPAERKNWRYRVLKPSKFWTRLSVPIALYLASNRPDVFFTPSHYIPRFSPVKRICTIFDLAYLRFPQMFRKKDFWQLKLWTKYSIKNADKILAISKKTKEDILEFYNISADKVVVTPLGYNQTIFKPINDKKAIKDVLSKYNIPPAQPYIIYIGTLQPRKNLKRLIEAFALVDLDLKLLIVGKTTEAGRGGWMFEEILKLPKKIGIEKKVLFTGFVPTEELPFLLAGSRAFILPSLYEGFGIPVLEAMACKTPVIVSNISSLPEVAGPAGIFIDPNSNESIKKAIELIAKDDNLREKKVQLGLEQLQKFSWENCAKETLKVLELQT
jgi:glycosyltransferase involved in cell wall biosynthesis